MAELENKVVLLTGASRGIGRATAFELAGQGAAVALVARSTGELDEMAAEIEQKGGRVLPLPADLATGQEGIKWLVNKIEANLGPVDILINNAAMAGPYGATWLIEPNEWVKAVEINLMVPFRLSRAVLTGMIERGWGRIINISSGAAVNPMENVGPYSLTKAGLDMFSRQLGIELAGSGVAAISVYPGIVDTEMQTDIRSQPAEKVGASIATRFKGYYESGSLLPAEAPARLVTRLAGEAGTNFNGKIVDIYSPEGQELLKI